MAENEYAEARVVAELAQRAATPEALDPRLPFVVVLDGGEQSPDRCETIDLERFLPEPQRARGVYMPGDADSFIAYATVHRNADATTLWVDQGHGAVTAVFNDHAAGTPGWGDHRATMLMRRTPEWEHWRSKDGALMSQDDFADHIQDGSVEVHEPDSATMLELAQSIQGTTNADWKTAKRLDTGEVGFSYTETIDAKAGRQGQLEIPAVFKLVVAPYYGEQPVEVVARLRYRVNRGQIQLGYKLERPDEVERNCLAALATRLSGEAGFARVYTGVPPGAISERGQI